MLPISKGPVLNRAMWRLPIVGKAGWMSASRDTIYLDLEQTIGPGDERILSAAADRQLVGGVVLGLCHDLRPLETSEMQSLLERPWTPAEVSLPETPLYAGGRRMPYPEPCSC